MQVDQVTAYLATADIFIGPSITATRGDIDQENLNDLVHKTEHYIDRKIRTLCLKKDEWEKLEPNLCKRPLLLLWQSEKEKEQV